MRHLHRSLAALLLLASSQAYAAAPHYAVVSANPMATAAGMSVLQQGGSAIDAAIAIQAVLGLVEPQSSGLGGGAFLLHYAAKTRQVRFFNGREHAPQAASPTMFMAANGTPLPILDAIKSGHAVGVPQVMPMLFAAHAQYGRLPWAKLFAPAIRLAREGFATPPRLAKLIAFDRANLAANPATAALFLPGGSPPQPGQILKNPAYAQTLQALAEHGPKALSEGPIAEQILSAVNTAPGPGGMTKQDLQVPTPPPQDALCAPYRQWQVCSVAPPSAGGVFVLQTLAMLSRFDLGKMNPTSADTAMLLIGAEHLAAADRDAYLADPSFVDVPLTGLLQPDYLRARGAPLSPSTALTDVSPGKPAGAPTQPPSPSQPEHGTSTLAVIDPQGDAVSMTTSVEFAFGSQRAAAGFVLNNQLTDFALVPQKDGHLLPNRAAPGKRPRSAMAPCIVLDAKGRLVAIAGSAGGSRIPGYVIRALTGSLDFNLPPQAALGLPQMGFASKAELEAGSDAAKLAPALQSRGLSAQISDMTSGSALILLGPHGIMAAADPRRDGTASIR